MTVNKPRVIKDYSKLDKELQEQIKLVFPDGFADNLIRFFDKNGKNITGLLFETEDKYYMVRMKVDEAVDIVDDDGVLKDNVRQGYEDKYVDLDSIADKIADAGGNGETG